MQELLNKAPTEAVSIVRLGAISRFPRSFNQPLIDSPMGLLKSMTDPSQLKNYIANVSLGVAINMALSITNRYTNKPIIDLVEQRINELIDLSIITVENANAILESEVLIPRYLMSIIENAPLETLKNIYPSLLFDSKETPSGAVDKYLQRADQEMIKRALNWLGSSRLNIFQFKIIVEKIDTATLNEAFHAFNVNDFFKKEEAISKETMDKFLLKVSEEKIDKVLDSLLKNPWFVKNYSGYILENIHRLSDYMHYELNLELLRENGMDMNLLFERMVRFNDLTRLALVRSFFSNYDNINRGSSEQLAKLITYSSAEAKSELIRNIDFKFFASIDMKDSLNSLMKAEEIYFAGKLKLLSVPWYLKENPGFFVDLISSSTKNDKIITITYPIDWSMQPKELKTLIKALNSKEQALKMDRAIIEANNKLPADIIELYNKKARSLGFNPITKEILPNNASFCSQMMGN